MVVRDSAARELDSDSAADLTPDPDVVERTASAAACLIPVLLPYQQAWVSDSSPVKVCVKSRRIGISWAVACEAVWLASRRKSQKGMDVWYLSQSERDAKEFIRDCAAWARVLDKRLAQKGSKARVSDGVWKKVRVLHEDGKTSVLATQIKFTSGHRITILPGKNPDVLRGKQGYVIFDEAALLDIDACLLAAQALKMSMKAGRIAFISTQRGEGNRFNRLVQDVRARKREVRRWTLHEYRLRDAIAQGYYRRRCVMQGQRYSKVREKQFFEDCMAELGAAQEYDCIPARDGQQYLPRDLIEKCQRDGRPVVRLERPAGWEVKTPLEEQREFIAKWCEINLDPLLERLVSWENHYVGQDFGRSAKGDLSAIAPMAIRDDKDTHRQIRTVPFVIEMTGVPGHCQRQILDYLVPKLPNFGGGKWDGQGNGSDTAEHAVINYGADRCESVKPSRQWYEEWLPQYKSAMQVGEIEIPNYSDLRNDHEQFALDDSVPILPKKRTKGAHGEQRHGDAAFACVLAYAASKAPTVSTQWTGQVPGRDPIVAW